MTLPFSAALDCKREFPKAIVLLATLDTLENQLLLVHRMHMILLHCANLKAVPVHVMNLLMAVSKTSSV